MLLCSFIQESWVISHRILIMNDLHLDDRALCYFYRNFPRCVSCKIILTFSSFSWSDKLIFFLKNMWPRGLTLPAFLSWSWRVIQKLGKLSFWTFCSEECWCYDDRLIQPHGGWSSVSEALIFFLWGIKTYHEKQQRHEDPCSAYLSLLKQG